MSIHISDNFFKGTVVIGHSLIESYLKLLKDTIWPILHYLIAFFKSNFLSAYTFWIKKYEMNKSVSLKLILDENTFDFK